jgi:hypothetical protein
MFCIKKFLLILHIACFSSNLISSHLIRIKNDTVENQQLFKITNINYLKCFSKILKSNILKILIFSGFGYDITDSTEYIYKKYPNSKPIMLPISKINSYFFLLKILQIYNSIILKNIPACYDQIKRNKNIDQNFILTNPQDESNLSNQFEYESSKYFKIIYIHGGARIKNKDLSKTKNLKNFLGLCSHFLSFEQCVSCLKNKNTKIKPEFSGKLELFQWNGYVCFKNRLNAAKSLLQLIIKTNEERKNRNCNKLPIIICAESYGIEVLGYALYHLPEGMELKNIIFISLGGLITEKTAPCFKKQIENKNKLILALSPLDPIANGFDVTNHSDQNIIRKLIYGYTPTTDRSMLLNLIKKNPELNKNICEIMVWGYDSKNKKSLPVEHHELSKNLFFNGAFFEIINNFEKFNNGRSNLLITGENKVNDILKQENKQIKPKL